MCFLLWIAMRAKLARDDGGQAAINLIASSSSLVSRGIQPRAGVFLKIQDDIRPGNPPDRMRISPGGGEPHQKDRIRPMPEGLFDPVGSAVR